MGSVYSGLRAHARIVLTISKPGFKAATSLLASQAAPGKGTYLQGNVALIRVSTHCSHSTGNGYEKATAGRLFFNLCCLRLEDRGSL